MFQGFYRANKELINKALFLIGFFLAVYIFVHYLFGYISPFVFGYIISLMLVPFVNFFDSRFKIHRGVSTAVFMAIVLFLLSILGTNIVSKVGSEIRAFAENWPVYLERLTATGNNIMENYDNLLTFVPEQFSAVAETALAALTASFTSALSSSVKDGSFNLVTSVPNFLMSTLLCIISVFFFTKDQKLIGRSIRAVAPVWLSDGYRTIKRTLSGALLGYIKAQLTLMTITATICILGLAIIRFPYALLIGLLTSLIDALPVFGAGFVLWPLALINLISGNYSTAIGIMIIYVTVIIVRQFLEPKILGSQIGLHPLLTLMSIYAGLKIFGPLGFVIGPAVLLIVKVILETGADSKPPAPTETTNNIII